MTKRKVGYKIPKDPVKTNNGHRNRVKSNNKEKTRCDFVDIARTIG